MSSNISIHRRLAGAVGDNLVLFLLATLALGGMQAFDAAKQLIDKCAEEGIDKLAEVLEEGLELHKYIGDLIIELEKANPTLKHQVNGQQFSFILGNTIEKIEITQYDTFYLKLTVLMAWVTHTIPP
ncbi:MAG: hypothetical protein WBF33_16385 [Candidatus Nitrosopolaris sp.]